ncbi:ribokinase [Isobaculum melis]|uniref:Ribokinase n=1 Tax=Isobaculum melis TaxID=142588 RepID=A0A1H9PLJ9_9LACT|nr:ribokinase [Isobaculum melis]SER49131.1 ribokinase [Isobaculum melis]
MKKLIVLGSLNLDLVMTTSKLPNIGETILGEDIQYMLGGKGANQAVAASRIGQDVTLLGGLGDDTFGEKIRKHLAEENLDLTHVKTFNNMFTGIASIFKLPTDNSIVVIPGANHLVDTQYLTEVQSVIQKGNVLLSQLEIPLETVKEGMAFAKEQQMLTILNPAPYHEGVKEIMPFVDIVTPNETEFEGLCGQSWSTVAELEQEMLAWSEANQTQLIVTRGEHGTSYTNHGKVIHLPAIQVKVVDTTGAGDTFNGILAYELSQGMSMDDAVRRASIGASLSVQAFGAQTGMPTKAVLDQTDCA